MRKLLYALLTCCVAGSVSAQSLSTEPGTFTAEDEVTLIFDVTGSSLEGYSDNIYLWAWIAEGCSADCDAPTNVNPGGAANADAVLEQDGTNPNIYRITLIPTEFYGKSPSEIKKMGVLAKGVDWSNGQTTDYTLDVEPLTFTPTIDRKFPTKASSEDVVTLYFDQTMAEDLDLKFQTGDFSVVINALDASGATVGSVTKDAVNAGEGTHYVRVLASFDFGMSNGISSLSYQFVAQDNAEVTSDTYSLEYLDLK